MSLLRVFRWWLILRALKKLRRAQEAKARREARSYGLPIEFGEPR